MRGVAIFKVGDDERSITNAATRFLDAQQGQMHDLVREVFHGHLRSIEKQVQAEALEKEADAVIGQQIAEQLPEIVRAASESFKHVDNLTVLNGAQGISGIIA